MALLQEVRRKLRTLEYAVNKVEAVEQQMAEVRFLLEFFRRNPEKGIRNGEKVASPEQFSIQLDQLEKEREYYVPILLYYTGTENETDAKDAFTRLMSAYNRVGSLRERVTMRDLGFTEDEIGEFNYNVEAELERALEVLDNVNDSVELPGPSLITLK